jgi:uncharacterized membrane protein HdeD (DUF308 family)
VTGLHPRVTLLLSGLIVVLGVILVIETALAGGGLGYLFGTMLALAGAFRIYLTRRA